MARDINGMEPISWLTQGSEITLDRLVLDDDAPLRAALDRVAELLRGDD